MSNDDRQILADLEKFDLLKDDVTELLRRFKAALRDDIETGHINRPALVAIREFERKHPNLRP